MKRKFKVFASTEKLSGKELDINYIRYLAADGPFDGEKVKYLTDDDISIIIDMLNSEYPNGVDEQKLFEFLCYDADTYAEWLGFEDSDALWEVREPNYNYLVESFLQDNFRGLVDDAYVEDLDEAIDVAHDFISRGHGSVSITNMQTGEWQGFTYDEYFDIDEDGFPGDFAESPFDRNLLACNNINSATSITASAWISPSGRKYGKQTRRFPGKYLFTKRELKQMVDNGDARYIGGNLDHSINYDVIGISWNDTNGHRTGILIEDRDTGELLVGNEGSASVARY